MAKKPNIKLRVASIAAEVAPVLNSDSASRKMPLNNMSQYYRPVKRQISIRLDADVLEWFQRQPGKYQSLINKALREFMEKQ